MNNSAQIIKAFGGTSEVARLCEIKPASVSEWKKKGIPKARIMFLKAIAPEKFSVSSNKDAA